MQHQIPNIKREVIYLVQYGKQIPQATKMWFWNKMKNQQFKWLHDAQSVAAYDSIFSPNQLHL
jgi:hypothetical protein